MPVVFAFLRCLLPFFFFFGMVGGGALAKKLLSLLEKADFAAGLLSQNGGERLRLMETWLEETLRPKTAPRENGCVLPLKTGEGGAAGRRSRWRFSGAHSRLFCTTEFLAFSKMYPRFQREKL
jgi:hypothetical protein